MILKFPFRNRMVTRGKTFHDSRLIQHYTNCFGLHTALSSKLHLIPKQVWETFKCSMMINGCVDVVRRRMNKVRENSSTKVSTPRHFYSFLFCIFLCFFLSTASGKKSQFYNKFRMLIECSRFPA